MIRPENIHFQLKKDATGDSFKASSFSADQVILTLQFYQPRFTFQLHIQATDKDYTQQGAWPEYSRYASHISCDQRLLAFQ
jgi:hypothetical protein